jgi:hypothetical protein
LHPDIDSASKFQLRGRRHRYRVFAGQGEIAGGVPQGTAGAADKSVKATPAAKSTAAPAAKTVPLETSAAASKWEDPGGIETGLAYADLVRRFGPPTLAITGDAGKTLTYSSNAGSFHVETEDDRVAAVR